MIESLREDLEEKRNIMMSLKGLMDKISKENQQLRLKQEHLQVMELLSHFVRLTGSE